jgi:hypothetical protein
LAAVLRDRRSVSETTAEHHETGMMFSFEVEAAA